MTDIDFGENFDDADKETKMKILDAVLENYDKKLEDADEEETEKLEIKKNLVEKIKKKYSGKD